MALTLAIENESRLADGGPLSVRVTGRRGIDIGRDQHLDWTLPDPNRFVSGKHCEIRYRDGGYWLHDVSSNGTFVNGSDRRMSEPHRLRNGDRLEIGHYIIAVTIDGEEAAVREEPTLQQRSDPSELWGVADEAPPIAASELRPARRTTPVQPDFLDWAVDVPDVHPNEPVFVPPRRPQPEPIGTNRSYSEPARPVRNTAQGNERDAGWGAGTAGSAFGEPFPAAPQRRGAPRHDATDWAEPRERAAPHSESPAHWPSAGRESEREYEALADGDSARPVLPRADIPPGLGPEMSFIFRLSRGAGVPEDVFAGHDPLKLAEELGIFLRIVTDNLKQLLDARSESRALTRNSRQTMIAAFDNNPLKFSPTAEEALRIMFGPRTKSYLDARKTLKQSFEDLKAHQIDTYAAMQQAVKMLMDDLDPQAIEAAAEAERGIGSVVGSRKSKLWEAYVARWKEKVAQHDNGLLDAFMLYFSECYRRNADKNR
jgi:type VI secretion system protein ImpI